MLPQPAPSPLRGKYLVRRTPVNQVLRLVDSLLGLVRSSCPNPPLATPPRRILLANGAHLGDVFLSTALLPVLQEAFPAAEFGFLIGSWSRPVVQDHPLLRWVHVVDHWKINRARISLLQKISQYDRTRRQALREIRQVRYEVALDLYYYFPNSIPLLWQAGIPTRIGYTSGGFGPLLTHALDFRNAERHVLDYQADLLRFLPLGKAVGELRPQMDTIPRHEPGWDLPKEYLVFHLGTGAAWKEWPREKWRALAEALCQRGHDLVFTGNREAERRLIQEVSRGLPSCVDLCGRLTLREFAAVLREARLLIGVDSVAGHLAAAVGTPCVVIAGGITHPAHWRPRSDRSRVLRHPVPCSPCYLSRGCAGMECVRRVEVEQVLAAVEDLLLRHWALGIRHSFASVR